MTPPIGLRGSAVVAFSLAILLSCASTQTQTKEQLESVAKNWALTIRASQMIPVYPLTEDLQPGDVLLVSQPIEEQVHDYEASGFLPLDQHMYRFYFSKFSEFYNGRYGLSDDKLFPTTVWQTQTATGSTTPTTPSVSKGDPAKDQGKAGSTDSASPTAKNESTSDQWDLAPHATFPSYHFSVQTGAGMNLAIPIQGVPFALGLMNTGSASGNITITEAYTYGLDYYSLISGISEWADSNRSLLASYAPSSEKPKLSDYQFLRVISRVFLARSMNVEIDNANAAAANLKAGENTSGSSPIDKLGATNDVSGDYQKLLEKLNTLASATLPIGANVSVAAASNRSVSLKESFKRPLVIGYMGFDLPILKGGRLGRPISTLDQLNGKVPRIARREGMELSKGRLVALQNMYDELKNTPQEQCKLLVVRLDKLADKLPSIYPFTGMILDVHGLPVADKVHQGDQVRNGKPPSFQDVLHYFGEAVSTRDILRVNDKTPVDAALSQDLNATQDSISQVGDSILSDSSVAEAIDLALLGIVD